MTKKVQLLTADSKQEVLHPETTADMVLVAVDQNLMEKLATLLPLAGGTMTGQLVMDGNAIRLGALSEYPRIGYDPNTQDVYISNANNNWFRIKVDRTMTIGGKKVYTEIEPPTAKEVGALPITGGTVTGNLEVTGTVQAQGRVITDEAFYVTNGTDGAFVAKLGGNGVDLGDTTKSTAICSSETPKYWDGATRWNMHNDKDHPIAENPAPSTLVQRNANGDVLGKNLLIDDGEIWNGVAKTLGIGMAHYSGSNDGYLRKLANGEMDIGHTNYKYRNVYATVGNINTSDVQLKENIEPVLSADTLRMINEETESHTYSSPTVEDYYNFVKELPLYTYDYKSEGGYNRALHNVGFIAQDIADTVVGHEFVFKGEDGIYQYNMQGYVGVLAVALQNAIKEIEYLKEQQKNKSRYVN